MKVEIKMKMIKVIKKLFCDEIQISRNSQRSEKERWLVSGDVSPVAMFSYIKMNKT